MEEVGAQFAHPFFLQQSLSSRFCEAAPMARKRDLPFQTPSYQHNQQQMFVSGYQNPVDWNSRAWDWDSVRFVAKPLESEILRAGNVQAGQQKVDEGLMLKKSTVEEDDERLRLNLAGGLSSVEEPTTMSRPNKRVRSGSPGSGSYPMCQVDNCKEDLSNAKDYHRRHKVCEVHSKSTKALVGKQMQRFCQQCSRFHPLSEFDEGKRSCRRRLAGHNRRRRKTQPEDASSHLLVPGNRENASSGNVDIINLLTAFARAQGKTEDKSGNGLSDRDQLLQILSKINSLPLPADFAAKLSDFGINRKFLDTASSEHQNGLNGGTTSPSTMDLLTILSATLAASAPEALAFLSQRSGQSSDCEKTKITCVDQAKAPYLQNRPPVEYPSAGGSRSSTSYQSLIEDSDCQVQEIRPNLPLQLFSSSPEDDSPPKLASSRKYFSSDSSNPMDERSPSSSPPVVQKFFPLQSSTEAVKPEKRSIGREVSTNFEVSRNRGCITPLELFGGSNTGANHGSLQNFQLHTGYASSSGSDHSPSSLNSDAQDRTGRIIFKLFDKDPSHLPGALRTEIYNWLSSSPSEMESYIRPGCVVLSLYLSMPSASWEKFEENLLQRVGYLIQHSDSDFWRTGRFLVHTGRQLASHKQGKIRLCKSWRTWTSPELISVSPLAVECGQETSLVLKGRNLSRPGTKIHCTVMGGYTTKEVIGLTDQGTMYDEIKLSGYKFNNRASGSLGRCFIEVENGFKGNSFPVIVADASICRELRVLESEFYEEPEVCNVISEDQSHDNGRPRSREEVLHFLNELGWLFQRRSYSAQEGPDFSLGRFRFLLTFSVERDWCTLVKTILDILVETNLDGDELSEESLGTLSDIQLLNRAVKRRCRNMVDLLINYYLNKSDGSSKKYIFQPNLLGPGGLTPLHLAACLSDSDDLIDALTNDPQENGLHSWNSLLDTNGKSPYAYAAMRNNHSYNKLVARKLADRRSSQVSVTIENEIQQVTVQEHALNIQYVRGLKSCAKCSAVATKYSGRFPGAHGLLHRPYIHSMLAIAAVCVCVCLFLRGSPDIGLVAPFKWENLDFGTK